MGRAGDRVLCTHWCQTRGERIQRSCILKYCGQDRGGGVDATGKKFELSRLARKEKIRLSTLTLLGFRGYAGLEKRLRTQQDELIVAIFHDSAVQDITKLKPRVLQNPAYDEA